MSQQREVILKINHVTKVFPRNNKKVFRAVDDVTLELEKGENIGIVGESGCGKSTLVKMIVNLIQPTQGSIIFRGQPITAIKSEELRQNRRKIQMVFQDAAAAFSPRMQVRDIICEPLINFGMIGSSQKTKKAQELLEMVGLDESFLLRYSHNMSGGQRQRVGIARAFALDPEIIICDEATSALDVSVQEQIMALLKELQRKKSIQYIFICHDVALVESFCDKLVVMYLGNVVEELVHKKLTKDAMHPYTKLLVNSIISVGKDKGVKLPDIKGEANMEEGSDKGCVFQNRCQHLRNICQKQKPILRKVEEGHRIACHLYGE